MALCRVLQGVAFSLLFCTSAFAQFTPDWRAIEQEQPFIFGKDGDFEVFILDIDEVTLLGVASTEPHDDTLTFKAANYEGELNFVYGTDKVAFFRIPDPKVEVLLSSEMFTFTVDGIELDVITGDLRSVFRIITNRSSEDANGFLIDEAICMLSKAFRRHAIMNRKAGLNEQDSFSKIVMSAQNDDGKGEVVTDYEAVREALIMKANAVIYQLGESLFGNEKALSNFQSLIHTQCLQENSNEEKSVNGLTEEQQNSSVRAEAFLAQSLKSLLKGQGVASEHLEILSSEFSKCMLGKIGEQSSRAKEIYIQELNKTESLIEARDRASVKIVSEGLNLDGNVLSQGLNACKREISISINK